MASLISSHPTGKPYNRSLSKLLTELPLCTKDQEMDGARLLPVWVGIIVFLVYFFFYFFIGKWQGDMGVTLLVEEAWTRRGRCCLQVSIGLRSPLHCLSMSQGTRFAPLCKTRQPSAHVPPLPHGCCRFGEGNTCCRKPIENSCGHS